MRHQFVIAVCLLIVGCAGPTYPELTDDEPAATILDQHDDGVFVCHSAFAVEVDGLHFSYLTAGGSFKSGRAIKPGDHTIKVQATSGPKVLWGAGCSYTCAAWLSFTAEPDHAYQLFHDKDAEPNRVNLTDVETSELVASSPCTYSNHFEQPSTEGEPAE